MPEVAVAIAGLRTSIATPDARLAAIVRERYAGFLSAGTPAWRLELRAGLADGAGDDVEVRRDVVAGRLTVRRADFSGVVDLGRRSASVALASPDEFSIDTVLRIAYSLALVEARGLVVHAASLVRAGQAFLFCGPSGSGKTTVARLSPDAVVLSDELSIARIAPEGVVCCSTPFWGELARAGEDRRAPLAGIYFLRHADRHDATALPPRRALERLLPNVLFFAREAELTGRVLGVAADLVEAVPCFDLAFRPDPGFWEVVADA